MLAEAGASHPQWWIIPSRLRPPRRGPDRRWKLITLETASGKERKAVDLDLPVSALISGLSLNPNGGSFATSAGYARYDIWLLEGFPPPPEWFSRLGSICLGAGAEYESLTGQARTV